MDLQKIKDFFAKDLYATSTTGIEILEAADGKAKVQMKLDSRHKNALGFTMGAVYFTMADFSFAVSVNSDLNSESYYVTLSSNINMMNTAKTDLIFAESIPLKRGRQTCFYQIDVYEMVGNEKRMLSVAQITGYKVNKAI